MGWIILSVLLMNELCVDCTGGLEYGVLEKTGRRVWMIRYEKLSCVCGPRV